MAALPPDVANDLHTLLQNSDGTILDRLAQSGGEFDLFLAATLQKSKNGGEKPSWKCGDWVAVTYLGQEYPGVVTQILGTETEVDCMVSSGKFWKWPNGWPAYKDLIWYSPQDVLKKISKPIPVSNRGQMKFSDF